MLGGCCEDFSSAVTCWGRESGRWIHDHGLRQEQPGLRKPTYKVKCLYEIFSGRKTGCHLLFRALPRLMTEGQAYLWLAADHLPEGSSDSPWRGCLHLGCVPRGWTVHGGAVTTHPQGLANGNGLTHPCFPCRSLAVVLVMSIVELPRAVFHENASNEPPFRTANVYTCNNKMPFWNQYCDAHQKVDWPSKGGKSQLAGRNTPGAGEQPKLPFDQKKKSRRESWRGSTEFHWCLQQTEQLRDACLPFAPHQDCFTGDAGWCNDENWLLHRIVCLLNQREFKEAILQKIILAASAGKFWHIPMSDISMLIPTREHEMQTINRSLWK